jgi:hypothetical protein
VFAVAALCGCSDTVGDDKGDRDVAGVVTQESVVSVDELRVGDCITKLPDEEEIGGMRAIPCLELHAAEVFHTYELPPGDFPSDETVRRGCFGPFRRFVGAAYEESKLDVIPIAPSEEGWAAGDRGVVCLLTGERRVTGSLKGTRR